MTGAVLTARSATVADLVALLQARHAAKLDVAGSRVAAEWSAR